MKLPLFSILPLVALSITIPVYAWQTESEKQIEHRCGHESLSTSKARNRILWAEKCEYITDAAKYQYVVVTDPITQLPSIKKRSRLLYPVFDFDGKPWAAPTTYNPNGKDDCFNHIRKRLKKKAFNCTSGCFTPDQMVWFLDGEMSILSAIEGHENQIMTLTDDSTLLDLNYQSRKVKSYTASAEDDNEKIYTFLTEDSKSIKVTHNHPLVSSSGFIKAAEDFVVGDSLVGEDGSFARIESIKVNDYFGKVYNVTPDSTSADGSVSLNGQIIVAQGFLSGSAYYQNEGVDFLNKYNIRESIDNDMFE